MPCWAYGVNGWCHPTSITVDTGCNAGLAALLFESWERGNLDCEPSACMWRRFDRTIGISLGSTDRARRESKGSDWTAPFPEATSFPRLREQSKYARRRGDALVPMNVPLAAVATSGTGVNRGCHPISRTVDFGCNAGMATLHIYIIRLR